MFLPRNRKTNNSTKTLKRFSEFSHLPIEDGYPLAANSANAFVESEETIPLYTALLWKGNFIAETSHGDVFASRWCNVPGPMLDDSRRSSF